MDDLNNLSVQLDFLEHVESPIFVKNQSGVYIFCNDAFSRFLGLKKNNCLRRRPNGASRQVYDGG